MVRISEAAILKVILGTLCPLVLFVSGWWIAGGLASYGGLPISETAVAVAALAGLAVGVMLDLLYLPTWIARFYGFGFGILLPLYLFLTAMATAFFMGLPLGNLVLGTVAGLYVGRRCHHAHQSCGAFARAERRVCLLAAAITGLATLPFAVMALREPQLVTWLRAISDWVAETGGILLVLLLTILLMVVQCGCTHLAAGYAFQGGTRQPSEG